MALTELRNFFFFISLGFYRTINHRTIKTMERDALNRAGLPSRQCAKLFTFEIQSENKDVFHVVDDAGFDLFAGFCHVVVRGEEQMFGDAFEVLAPEGAVIGN